MERGGGGGPSGSRSLPPSSWPPVLPLVVLPVLRWPPAAAAACRWRSPCKLASGDPAKKSCRALAPRASSRDPLALLGPRKRGLLATLPASEGGDADASDDEPAGDEGGVARPPPPRLPSPSVLPPPAPPPRLPSLLLLWPRALLLLLLLPQKKRLPMKDDAEPKKADAASAE
jgi:hypothetical protein